MAKRAAKKTGGVRNPDRSNGKAFSRKRYDDKGRALTGRGKPSGRSVRGMKRPPCLCGCDNRTDKPEPGFAGAVARWNASLPEPRNV